jgi:hypothetical protein
MATLTQMTERLSKRFTAVTAQPALEAAAIDVMADTFELFGYEVSADVPITDINRLLAYGSSELALQIALDAARFFKYTDGEESVDKSMVSKEYRAFAALFKADYLAEEAKQAEELIGGSVFRVMRRLDRP